MRVTTIGTGAAAPDARRVNPGHLVEAGAVRLLLDCGSGVSHRMAELGLAWSEITHVALTHFHADHTSDVATLMVAWRYGQLPPRAAPLTIVGPGGTRELLSRLAGALWGDLLAPGFEVRVVEIAPGDALDLGDGVTLSACKVPHTDESVAYSVERAGRRLVYSGDTAFDAPFAEWARGADVLLCECSLPDTMPVATHMTPSECGRLGALALPRLLALVHLYPPVDTPDLAETVGALAGVPTVVAHDGWAHTFEEG